MNRGGLGWAIDERRKTECRVLCCQRSIGKKHHAPFPANDHAFEERNMFLLAHFLPCLQGAMYEAKLCKRLVR